jgi:predicted component of type VI protein secretion system
MVRIRLPSGWIMLPAGIFLIGRSADCHIVLDRPRISRVHARLISDGQSAKVEDAGSANGLFVNGRHIVRGPFTLSNGDLLQVGDVEIEIGYGPAKTRVRNRTTERPPASVTPTPSEATKPSLMRELIEATAEHALNVGDAQRAEQLLRDSLKDALTRAREGQPLDPKAAQSASQFALRLARLLGAPAWADYVIELHTALSKPIDEPILNALTSARPIAARLDPAKLANHAAMIQSLPTTPAKLGAMTRVARLLECVRPAT